MKSTRSGIFSILALFVVALALIGAVSAPASAEVFLKGNFVEVGINNAGSFGTSGYAPAGFHPKLYPTTNRRLGFVADPGKDGWTVGTPPQTGDYFVPGTPEEGWMVEWTSGSVERQFHNFGLMYEFDTPMTKLTETSSGDTRSAVWEGTATYGNEKLKVIQTVSYNVNDLFFAINVVLTNVGTVTLKSLEYMRNVDPDQEQPLTMNYTTRNWVEFQPGRTGVPGRPNLAARPAGNTNKALTVAEGLTHKLTLGLGTIDSRAVVTASQGFSNRDTDAILNTPTQPTSTSPSIRDAAIALAYNLGDLAPGQSTSVTYAYILNKGDLDKALGNLAAVTILQPTGTVSGTNVLFQATTDKLPSTSKIDFYVNGQLVGTDSTPDAGGVFETTFSSLPFPNGTATLKAVATFNDGSSVEKTTSVSVDNSGPAVAFDTPVTGQIFSDSGIPIAINVLDATHPPVRVSFFRETAGTGSTFLGEDTAAPFTSSFSVIGLPEGETVVIKAVAYDSLNRVTTITVSGTTQTDRAPIANAGADFTVECAGTGTSVSLNGLGSSDPDGDPLTYTWSGPFGTATGPTPAVSLNPGTNTIILTVADGKGKSATDTVVVTIADTVPPVVDAGPDVTLEATGPDGAAYDPAPVASDICCDVTILISPKPALYPLGVTTVVATATDCAGNQATDSMDVKVVDTTAPVVTPPADVTAEATGLLTEVTIGTATATDAVGVVSITSDAAAAFPVGPTTVTWTAVDAAGNKGTATSTVTVVDTTPPVVTPPADITVEASAPLTPVTVPSATATDAVGVISITSNAPASYPLGTTKITWTAVDAADNKGTATSSVTVVDTTPPVLEGIANQVLEATSAAGAIANFKVTATDKADPAPVVTCSSTSGSIFPLGTTTVTCSATDKSGNSATDSFTILVQDTTPPTLNVPADIHVVLNTPLDASYVVTFLGGASASDIVDSDVTISHSGPSSLSTVGAKTVTFTAKDDNGNATTKTATIWVEYSFGGFLTPVSLDRPFKLGSTVPVKFQLYDVNGSVVTSSTARFYLQQYLNNEPAGELIEVTSTSGADTGNYFRVADSIYIYNLETKTLSQGTWQILAVLDDGTTKTRFLYLR